MQYFLSCLFCGSQVKFPEKNASFYRNHLVALHNVDHRFPGMNIIVNQTIHRQLRNNKCLTKINVTSRKQNVTKRKVEKTKQKTNIHLRKTQCHSQPDSNTPIVRNIESSSEDIMLHEAALGKFTVFWMFPNYTYL